MQLKKKVFKDSLGLMALETYQNLIYNINEKEIEDLELRYHYYQILKHLEVIINKVKNE